MKGAVLRTAVLFVALPKEVLTSTSLVQKCDHTNATQAIILSHGTSIMLQELSYGGCTVNVCV